jgi:hypothetical protein
MKRIFAILLAACSLSANAVVNEIWISNDSAVTFVVPGYPSGWCGNTPGSFTPAATQMDLLFTDSLFREKLALLLLARVDPSLHASFTGSLPSPLYSSMWSNLGTQYDKCNLKSIRVNFMSQPN